VNIYIHYLIRLYGVVLSYLSTGATFILVRTSKHFPDVSGLILAEELYSRQADRHTQSEHPGAIIHLTLSPL
jgi:hypothetical protein